MTLDKDLDNLPEGQKKKEETPEIDSDSISPDNMYALECYIKCFSDSNTNSLSYFMPYLRFDSEFCLAVEGAPRDKLLKLIGDTYNNIKELIESTDLLNDISDKINITRTGCEGVSDYLNDQFGISDAFKQIASTEIIIPNDGSFALFVPDGIRNKYVKFCKSRRKGPNCNLTTERLSIPIPTITELSQFVAETGDKEVRVIIDIYKGLTKIFNKFRCDYEEKVENSATAESYDPVFRRNLYQLLKKNNPILCYKG